MKNSKRQKLQSEKESDCEICKGTGFCTQSQNSGNLSVLALEKCLACEGTGKQFINEKKEKT